MMKLNAKKVYFLILLVSLLTICLCIKFPIKINTSFYDLLPNQTTSNIPQIIQNKYSSLINIIVEGPDFQTTKNKADKFYEKLVSKNINNIMYTIDDNIVDKLSFYLKNHKNSFLREEDRKWIINKNYSTLTEDSINYLSTSIMPNIISVEEDPFSLLNKYSFELLDTPLNWQIKDNILWQIKNNIHYIYLTIQADSQNIEDLYNLISKINTSKEELENNNFIHLSGTPLHTLKMYEKSKKEITIISSLASILLIMLAFLLFKNIKYVFQIICNLLIAFLSGMVLLIISSNEIHLLSFIFGTSVIGICIDYSFHKMYVTVNSNEDEVKKEILYSFITTVCCFLPLQFSSIPLLRQISTFTIGGLLGTILWINFQSFKYINSYHNYKFPLINRKIGYYVLMIFFVFIITNIHSLNIQNNISKFYSPDTELKNNEELFYKLNSLSTSNILVIKAESIEEILETEEDIIKNYKINGLSRFLPSKNRQSENYKLIKELYEYEADNIKNELGLNKTPVLDKQRLISIKEFKKNFGDIVLNKFITYEGKYIWYTTPVYQEMNNLPHNASVISIQKNIMNSLNECAKEIYEILVCSILILFSLVFLFYKKNAIIYLLPSVISVFGCLIIINIIYGYITFFHLISLFIVLGLSIDYTIFHMDKNNFSNIKPVFFSYLSSFISFGLLMFTSFNVISIMGTTIAIGLTISYVISLIISRLK